MEATNAGNISLVGGALALDFANTASGRHVGLTAERLAAPGDVVAWAEHAGAVDAKAARRARTALADESEADRLLRHAKHLREAIYAIGVAVSRGEAAPENDLGVVREFARRAMGSAAFVRQGAGGYRFDFSAAPTEASLLGPIAWSAVDLLQNGRLDRVKQCPGEDCGWLFIDNSKNGSRRWCDMATCGNRTKVHRHRQHRHPAG
jgi:predicted RNA-binding Zn ribbon-like protein